MYLACDTRTSIKLSVLNSPRITPEIFGVVVQFADDELTAAVAQHELTPQEIRASLAFDSNYVTRSLAAKFLSSFAHSIRLGDWVRDNLGYSSGRYMALVNDILRKGEDPSWLVSAGRLLKKVYFDNPTMFYKILLMMRRYADSGFLAELNNCQSSSLEKTADFLRQLKGPVRIRLIILLLRQKDATLFERFFELISVSRPMTLEAITAISAQKSRLSLEKIITALEKSAEKKERQSMFHTPAMLESLVPPAWFISLQQRKLPGDESYTLTGATSACQIKSWGNILKNCLRTHSIRDLLSRQCSELFLGIFDSKKKLKYLVAMDKRGDISEAKGYRNSNVEGDIVANLKTLIQEEIGAGQK